MSDEQVVKSIPGVNFSLMAGFLYWQAIEAFR